MIVFAWLRKHWATLVLIFIALGTFWALRGTALMNQRAKYTIGYLTGWHYTAKSGRAFDYRFTVNGAAYEGASSGDGNMSETPGSRFVVKYDSIAPMTSVGYFALFIPDSIHQAPPRGWRQPPFPIPQRILNQSEKDLQK